MSDRYSNHDEASAERSPWTRLSVLLSGVFLLALVLLGLVVAVIGAGSSRPGRPTRTPTAASRPAKSSTGSQAVPSGSPPQAQWGTVGSMQVPQNPAVYGPQRTSGIWNSCFAHNPSGALLAAMNFYGESTTGEPEETVMRRYAVGAPSNLGSNAGLNSSGPVQLAGYRYDSYT